jgi:hypothetical protein
MKERLRSLTLARIYSIRAEHGEPSAERRSPRTSRLKTGNGTTKVSVFTPGAKIHCVFYSDRDQQAAKLRRLEHEHLRVEERDGAHGEARRHVKAPSQQLHRLKTFETLIASFG